MKEILFLSTEFKYRLWGGQKLTTIYNQKLPYENTGEAWCISAHPNGPSTILNGVYKGMTLDKLYEVDKSLFGNLNSKDFPLLVKIIDANDDLSIQVHPNDELAAKYHSLGKTECWYILDASADAYIIMGHHALTKEEFIEKVSNGQWDSLLRKVPVKKGDFFYIPAGVLHAIGKGLLILETQQSSDITYRLYDYDRIDQNGLPRPLHLKEGIAATSIPSPTINTEVKIIHYGDNIQTILIDSVYFKVEKYELSTPCELSVDKFKLITFIEGSGLINNQPFKKGDSCLVTNDFNHVLIMPNENTCFISSSI
jgi:mannose-6-phosphate isomerase